MQPMPLPHGRPSPSANSTAPTVPSSPPHSPPASTVSSLPPISQQAGGSQAASKLTIKLALRGKPTDDSQDGTGQTEDTGDQTGDQTIQMRLQVSIIHMCNRRHLKQAENFQALTKDKLKEWIRVHIPTGTIAKC
jgi:hypothetical protein